MSETMDWNIKRIIKLLDSKPNQKMLDIGCGEGITTLKIVSALKIKTCIGLDINESALITLRKRGINAIKCDLNKRIPIKEKSFDFIFSNQVIEHLIKIDSFLDEIHRLLKPGGYLIISTDNLSSWHNILSLIFGMQPFSDNISSEVCIGNKFSIHRGSKSTPYGHIKLFSPLALKEILELHHFKVEIMIGIGFYPFKGIISKFLERIDPYHARFITIKARCVNDI
jgi:SAM-dependent methyltransferase